MAVPASPEESGGDKILFLVYDNSGTNAAALQKAIAQATVNGTVIAHGAVATGADAAARAASQPIVLVAGDDGANIRALKTATDGTLKADPGGTFAGSRHKNVTTTGTAVAIAGSVACRRVRIKADPGNAAVIRVGLTGVTNDETEGTGGYQLSAGQELDLWGVANLNLVFINGTAADGVSFVYWT